MEDSRRVVVAVDESAGAVRALLFAAGTLKLGAVPGDELHVVTAVAPPLPPAAAPGLFAWELESWNRTYDADKAQAQALCQSFMHAAVEHGVPLERIKLETLFDGKLGIVWSGVGPTLEAYAKKVEADAVVLGSRGMGAFKRMFSAFVGLGSVSDHVAHNATCPVVVVRGELGDPSLEAKVEGVFESVKARLRGEPVGAAAEEHGAQQKDAGDTPDEPPADDKPSNEEK